MKKIIIVGFVILFSKCYAQKPFSNCSAAFLGDKMIVEEYNNVAKCKVSKSAQGELNVSTVEISGKNSKALNRFSFGIGIKDKDTGTLILFSKEVYRKIDIQKILVKCKKGDSILLLTINNEYALPHNEILVE